MRPQHEILEELVTGVRGLNTRIRDFDPEYMEKDRIYRRRKMRFHPRMFDEFVFMAGEMDDAPAALLFMAGFIREDVPWLAELLTVSYREIRDGSPDESERALNRLRRSIKHLGRGGIMREMMGYSKEAMMVMEELPMFLDMAIHHMIERSGQTKAVEDKSEDD